MSPVSARSEHPAGLPRHYGDPDEGGVILIEPEDPPQQDPWGWREFLVNLAEVTKEALCDWAYWHVDRAEARGIEDDHERGNMPLEWLAEVAAFAAKLSIAVADDAPDGELEALCESLHYAISQAKFDAERAVIGYGLGTLKLRWRKQQSEEVETSYLRGWARNFDSIVHCFCMARSEPADGFKWATEAAYTLAFAGLPKEAGK